MVTLISFLIIILLLIYIIYLRFIPYRNREENLIENTVLEQEITTKSIDNLKPIELQLENGQIYSNKIELKNLHNNQEIGNSTFLSRKETVPMEKTVFTKNLY